MARSAVIVVSTGARQTKRKSAELESIFPHPGAIHIAGLDSALSNRERVRQVQQAIGRFEHMVNPSGKTHISEVLKPALGLSAADCADSKAVIDQARVLSKFSKASLARADPAIQTATCLLLDHVVASVYSSLITAVFKGRAPNFHHVFLWLFLQARASSAVRNGDLRRLRVSVHDAQAMLSDVLPLLRSIFPPADLLKQLQPTSQNNTHTCGDCRAIVGLYFFRCRCSNRAILVRSFIKLCYWFDIYGYGI